MIRLSLTYLGTIEVKLDGKLIEKFRSVTDLALLLYLSLNPERPISRDILANLFWPNHPTSKAKQNLRQSLKQLRKMLPDTDGQAPFILPSRQAIQFNPNSSYECDVEQFQQAFELKDFLQAADLFQGELAEGFSVESPKFNAWLTDQRKPLNRRGIIALSDQVRRLLSVDQFDQAEEIARKQIALLPESESGHQNLVLTFAIAGERKRALDHYASVKENLLIDPHGLLKELAEKLEAGETVSLIRMGQNVDQKLDPIRVLSRLDPLPDQKLFGVGIRRKNIIDALSATQQPWIVSIDGLGGIGKTSLANEIVHRFIREERESDRFLDIAWVSAKQEEYVTGRGIQSTNKPALDAESLIDQLLAQLAEGPYPANTIDAKRTALFEILKTKTCLVVIDNLETIADYEAILPLVRFLSKPSKFLITSRMSLHNEDGVYCLNLNELSKIHALDFIRHEAKVQNIERIKAASGTVKAEIYETVGGNPLAIKLALGQAHFLPIDQILENLKLAKETHADQLYIYIYWQAWEMLGIDGRQLLISLPTMPNGSFMQLEKASSLASEPLQQALNELRSLSLVEVGGNHTEPRYRLHRLTETFLLHEVVKWQEKDKANRPPESKLFEDTIERTLDHWQNNQDLATFDVKELDEESSRILKTIQLGLDHEPFWPMTKELISSMTGYMERRGHWSVWYSTLNRAIEVAQRLNDINGELEITNLRGRVLSLQGKRIEVTFNYRRIIRIAKKSKNKTEEARACSNLGFTFIDRHRWWRAKILCCHALKIFGSPINNHGLAHTHNHLGILYHRMGNYLLSFKHLELACQIWKKKNDNFGLIKGLENLGDLHNSMKSYSKALLFLDQALELAETIGDQGSLPGIMLNLSYTYIYTSKNKRALNFAEHSENLFQDQGNFQGVFESWFALGTIHRNLKSWENAKKYLEASKIGFKKINYQEGLLAIEISDLSFFISSNKWESAKKSMQAILDLGEQNKSLLTRSDFSMAVNQFNKYKNKKG